jgi:hypothetical protein
MPEVVPPKINAAMLEAEHPHSSTVDVKNTWSDITIPPYVFMASCLIKHRDNFLLYSIMSNFIEIRQIT